jgi:hypothetical protein
MEGPITINNIEAAAYIVIRYRSATERFGGYREVGLSSAVPIEKRCDRGPLLDLTFQSLRFSPLNTIGWMQF